MAEEREVPQQQVQDFLLREFGLFLWLDEALVEDDELHQCIASGSPTLETMLKDGLRLCKLVRLIDPDCVPAVKENETHLAYKCRQNIKLFLEACEELGVPAYNRFFVSDLWDEQNLVRVLECVEKLAEIADAKWDFPFKLKGKKKLIAQTGKIFTKQDQERATGIVKKCIRQVRVSASFSSPVVREEESVGAAARARPMSIAAWSGGAAAGGHNGVTRRDFQRVPGFPSPASRRPGLANAFPAAATDSTSKTKPNTSKEERRALEEQIRREHEQQQQLSAEEKQYRGVIRFQSLYRGHRARKEFRHQMRMALRRENVAREIYRTEHSYVFNLRLLVHVFLSSLDASRQWQVKGGSPIEMEKMKILSRQIAPILGFNKKLINEYLEPRMQNWNFHSKLGDIFVQIAAYLKLYCDYVNNYGPALQELLEAKKKSSALAAFLKTQQEIPREFAIPSGDIHGKVISPYLSSPEFKRSLVGRVGDIGDYLIQPIQRIPRYLLLLTELLRYTDPSHPDYEELGQALKGIKEVTEFIEAQTNKAQNLNKLASIQSRLHPANQIKLVQPHRKFLREGKVMIKHKKDKKERVLILFNDLLLDTKPKLGKSKSWDDCPLSIKQALDLSSISAISKIAVDEHSFLIVNEDKRLQAVLLEVCCSSKMERYDWITAIHGAKRQLTIQILQRAELIGSKAGGADRVSGAKTFTEGKGTKKEAVPKTWESASLESSKSSLPSLPSFASFASIGRSAGRAMSNSELGEKKQSKEKKVKEKSSNRPEKVMSDMTGLSSTPSPPSAEAYPTPDQDGEANGGEPKKGHTRNKSWTLSFKEMSKRRVEQPPRKEATIGEQPITPRSPGLSDTESDTEASEPPPSQQQLQNGSEPSPRALFPPQLLPSVIAISPRSAGGTTGMRPHSPSFGSSPQASPRTSFSSNPPSSSALSSPRTSGTIRSPPSNGPSLPSPRSNSPKVSPPPSQSGTYGVTTPGRSTSAIIPTSSSSSTVPTVQRAISSSDLSQAASVSAPSFLALPTTGADGSSFSPSPPSGGRRPPPPVPSKSSKPAALLGQSASPRGIANKSSSS